MKMRRYHLDPVLRASGFRCAYCGKDLLADSDSLVTVVRDHLVAASAGGPDGPCNRVASCAACDRLKGDAVVGTVEEARRIIEGRRLGVELWRRRIRAAVAVEA